VTVLAVIVLAVTASAVTVLAVIVLAVTASAVTVLAVTVLALTASAVTALAAVFPFSLRVSVRIVRRAALGAVPSSHPAAAPAEAAMVSGRCMGANPSPLLVLLSLSCCSARL